MKVTHLVQTEKKGSKLIISLENNRQRMLLAALMYDTKAVQKVVNSKKVLNRLNQSEFTLEEVKDMLDSIFTAL